MKKLFTMLFGSHLYGTDGPASDRDFKGVFVPSKRDLFWDGGPETIQIVRKKREGERNTASDVDEEFFSAKRFVQLLCQGQTVALDMLFGYHRLASKDVEINDPWFMEMVWSNKNELLTKNINAFVGYARQQAAKYGIKGSRMEAVGRVVSLLSKSPREARLSEIYDDLSVLIEESKNLVSLEKAPLMGMVRILQPGGELLRHFECCGRKFPLHTKVGLAYDVYSRILEEYGSRSVKAHLNGGKDWKALSHAVRVNSQALELLVSGHITFPRPDAKILYQIKTGAMDYEDVAYLIESGLAELSDAHKKSTLRDEPDMEVARRIVEYTYDRGIKDEHTK